MDLDGNVTMKCPGCDAGFTINLEQVHPGNSHKCASCGAIINFTGDDGREAAEALRRLRSAIDSLKSTAKRFGR